MTDFDSPPSKEPRIAVLIPAYNEEVVLEGTIKALVEAGTKVTNIYVVDDRSTDHTVEIAKSCGVHAFTVPVNGGKANAQKAALEHFQLIENYEWIVFLDGDTKVDKDFMVQLALRAVKDPTVALYVGQVKSARNSHVFSAARAVEYAYGQDLMKSGQSNFNVIFVSPGCSSMYQTKMLSQLHIDHLTLAEDMDLTVQVHRKGGRVVYVPEAMVYTQDPATLKDYNKQILRWYRGFWQVIAKHGTLSIFRRKQRIDWYMLLLIVDAIVFNRAAWLIGLMIYMPHNALPLMAIDVGAAGLVTLYGAFRTRRWDCVFKFPLTYFITYLNIFAYTRSLVEIVVLKKELLTWNKVARYEFGTEKPDQPL